MLSSDNAKIDETIEEEKRQAAAKHRNRVAMAKLPMVMNDNRSILIVYRAQTDE